MDIFNAVIYGVVEGITEFLPVSSTGHLMIVTELFGNEKSTFLKTFEIAIQLGAILAVIVLFPRRLFADRAVFLRVTAGFIPTAVLGLLFYDIIKEYLLESVLTVLVALFIGGIFILWFESRKRDDKRGTIAELPLGKAALVGAMQAIAFIPGVSRSLATIFGGIGMGLSRKEAVEFSFFLAVPTMGAATALDLWKNYAEFTKDDMNFLIVGFATAFVTAILAIRFLMRYVTENDFRLFGIYRILAAIVFALIFFL